MTSGSQSISCPVQKSDGKCWFIEFGRPTRRFTGRVDLNQRKPRMIEKGLPSRRKLNAAGITSQKLGAHIVFQVADLTTEGRLRGVK